MTYKKGRIIAYGLAAVIMAQTMGANVQAAKLSDLLPSAGIGVTFSNGVTLAKIQESMVEEAVHSDNRGISLSEMRACLNERRTAPRTIVSASIVKTVNVQQILAQIEVEQAALARAERLAGEPFLQQLPLVSTEKTEPNVLATVANAASGEAVISAKTDVAADEVSVLRDIVRTVPEMTAVYAEAPSAAMTLYETTLPATGASAATSDTSSAVLQGTKSSVSGNDLKKESENGKANPVKEIEKKVIETTQSTTELAAAQAVSTTDEEKEFSNLVIAKVNDYVNVRSDAGENYEVVGKLYDKSVGTYLSEKDGWFEINSGNVTGYVKGEFCVTGKDAVALAKEVGTRVATVTTTTLKVRENPSTSAKVLGLVPMAEELTVLEEGDGWVKVDVEEGYGWVSMDYVTLRTDFVKAESAAEEQARLAKEAEERRKAQAAAAARFANPESGGSKNYNSASSFIPAGSGSASGNAVAQFALQFVGNPYVYGGTSLTNGADCSGFVMSVYNNFGVSLPHSSSADRYVGSAVGSLEEAQPGDLICYSGHVALYIGGNQIVHASSAKTGIKVSRANYRNILAIRRIF